MSSLQSTQLIINPGHNQFTSSKTKKKKTNTIDKKDLWDKFDVVEGINKVEIECVFIKYSTNSTCAFGVSKRTTISEFSSL